MFSEKSLREGAAACFQNAQSLHDEAELLVANGYQARAVALAIIGVEEFAKAVAYTMAALLPDERALLRSQLSSHEIKHLVAGTAEAAEIETHEFIAILRQEVGYWPSSQERLEVLLRRLAEYGLRALLSDRNEARRFWDDLQTECEGTLVPPEKKNASLYVDLSPSGEVLAPERVSGSATSELMALGWFLNTYHGLPEILRDDEAWNQLANRIRKLPPA